MKMMIFFFILLLSISISAQPREMQFNFYYTGIITGYDFQSNGTPQQIWQDEENPQNVHAVFMHSDQPVDWPDRNAKYLFSSNMGNSWNNMGNVQVGLTARGGYPSISGLNDGRPVIGLHTNDSITTTTTQIYVRNPEGTNWNRYNPGSVISGMPIWPRVLGIGNNHVLVSASINNVSSNDFLINNLNLSTGTFAGWSSLSGNQEETYCIEKSPDESVLAIVNVGSDSDSNTLGNLYYRESLDGGLSWSNEQMIYHRGFAGDSMSAFKGVDMIFLDHNPYVVFEIVKLNPQTLAYSDTLPNKIMMWSPALNGGVSFTLVESGVDVPYYHNYADINDFFLPVCRPTIGRSKSGNLLFVAMNVVTEHYLHPNALKVSYYAGYIMYSFDAGESWSIPEKFTPDSPLMDWRYVSISPTNSITEDYDCIIQMVIQADTVPGSLVNMPVNPPLGPSAEIVCIRGSFFTGVDDNMNKPDRFYLFQNYPNPFNPNTTISFNISKEEEIKLVVYDLVGREIKILVDDKLSAGQYRIEFNAAELSSGVYFYKLTAGSFTETKKLEVLK